MIEIIMRQSGPNTQPRESLNLAGDTAQIRIRNTDTNEERILFTGDKYTVPEGEPGPTGEYPQGHMSKDDEGALQIAIGVENGKVAVIFGKAVCWLGLDKYTAIALAYNLLDKAKELT